MLRLALVVSSAVALSGCGPVVCTLIGCDDALSFALGAQAAVFGEEEAVSVRACLDDDCVTETLVRQADGGIRGGQALMLDWTRGEVRRRLATAPSAGAHRASITLTKNGTVAFEGSREGVTFTTSNPNGPGCGPTCHTATVSL